MALPGYCICKAHNQSTGRDRERSGRQLTQQWEWINTPSLQEHDQILNTIRQGLKQLLVKSVYTGNFFSIFFLLFWNLKKEFLEYE